MKYGKTVVFTAALISLLFGATNSYAGIGSVFSDIGSGVKTVVMAPVHLFTGGGHSYTMHGTSVVPAAEAKLHTHYDKDDRNTNVMLDAKNLANPTLLSPTASAYVVWVKPPAGPPIDQGVLNVGSNEEARTDFTTASRNFEVLITAENGPRPKRPSDRVVLEANIGTKGAPNAGGNAGGNAGANAATKSSANAGT